jgi:hypothetical protein
MTQASETTTEAGQPVREVVAHFSTRAAFDGAVKALMDAGFDRADLSVLASHNSLEVAERRPLAPKDEALTGLVGELKYLFPLSTAGLLAIVGGPITAPLAALVTAGIGGLAIKDYLDEVTSHPDTDAFAKALEAGGVILWVRVADTPAELDATTVLKRAGGENVHTTVRTE